MGGNRPAGRWRLVIAAGVALTAVGLVVRWTRRAERAGQAMIRVEVERRDLTVTKTATGEVRPQNRVEVKPPIAGRIEQVLVKEGDTVRQGQVLAWMSSTERAALLDAARAQDAQTVARWEDAYKPAPLSAPLDGTVIVRAVEPGQTVTTTDPIVVVADRLIVNAQVDETDIGAIRVGQPASISLDAYPQQAIAATVDHVAYEATTVNNVTIYNVDVLPQQVPHFMRSGMTANVTFTVATTENALVVPSEAVRQQDGESTVLAMPRGPGKPSLVTAVTGLSDGKHTQITSGLSDGDLVFMPSLKIPGKSRRAPRSPLAPSRRGGRRS